MVHPTAIIDPSVKLGSNVSIGPYSVIGADVTIGDDCVIGPHVVIKGETHIGKNNQFFQFSSVGEDCQDKKYAGEPTKLVIGDNNIIREFVTIHRGTIQDNSVTIIGNDNLLMNYVHIAHDCVIGNNTIIANGGQIAGHVTVGDGAIVGGSSAVHQFSKIGEYAMIGGGTIIVQDVPAFVTVQGNPAKSHGMNYEGMKRRGYSKDTINQLRKAYKLVYRKGIRLQEALAELKTWADESGNIKRFIDSVEQSTRGIIR